MMIKKEVFQKIGCFDEEMSHSWQDVDLCIRVIELEAMSNGASSFDFSMEFIDE